MLSLNPDLCPTHKCEMDWLPYGYVCKDCRTEAYSRITQLKLKAVKLRRNMMLSRWPSHAGLFEGL